MIDGVRWAADSPCVDCLQPSPNHGERRDGRVVDTLILHYTGMPDDDQACRWLCNPQSEVSSHYFIHKDGRTVQLVPETRRAWHAGAGSWRGETDINSCSIGIEIANAGHPAGLPDFPEPQIAAVIRLGLDIVGRRMIPADRILGHSDMAPGRKVDPGENFPWKRLHQAGLGHWTEPRPIVGGTFFQEGDDGAPVEALQAMLADYGYGLEVTGRFGAETRAVVTAFQQHFRPARVDGIADTSTIETLYALSRSRPRAVIET